MKRAYEIELERGERWQGETYIVVAAAENDVKTGWRCVSLKERSAALVG